MVFLRTFFSGTGAATALPKAFAKVSAGCISCPLVANTQKKKTTIAEYNPICFFIARFI
jgi:O-acetyl-ADP-ribose deacetylase (regulator of RNase III)